MRELRKFARLLYIVATPSRLQLRNAGVRPIRCKFTLLIQTSHPVGWLKLRKDREDTSGSAYVTARKFVLKAVAVASNGLCLPLDSEQFFC